MAKQIIERVYIASIYPGELEQCVMFHGENPNPKSARSKVYRIPPVPKATLHSRKKFEVLEIPDCFENVLDVQALSDTHHRVFTSKLVTCEEIRDGLMRYWAGGMIGLPPGAGIGLMAIAGTVPTQAEYQKMLDMQQNFYEYKFQEAEHLAMRNDWKRITRVMRDAALYLGKKRAWVLEGAITETRDCPHCFQPIPSLATVCFVCHRDVVPFGADAPAPQTPAKLEPVTA